MDKIFIGKHNSRLRDIRRAVRSGKLTPDGLLPVEGSKLLTEAIRAGLKVDSAFLCDHAVAPDLPKGIHVYELSEAVFKGIQSTEHSQGILGLVRPAVWNIEDVLSRSPAPIIILARLQDPGNVGTILRVSEAFDAAGCVALEGTAGIYNPKVVRASAGSIFRVPHSWDISLTSAVNSFRSRRIPIIGTSPHATQTIASWNWNQPAALLVGNEGSGLSVEESDACDLLLRIPQRREIESLNSAIATSIILFESYQRRHPE